MKINKLIDRNVMAASDTEDIRVIKQWLKKCEYLAITDKQLHTIGIVTLKDLLLNEDCLVVSDYNISKPKVSSEQTIFEVFKLMKETGADFLPVYENNSFIGVIALMTITGRLTEAVNETGRNYQKVIHDIRNPLSNLQGLMNILTESITDAENQELINLCKLSCKHAIDIAEDLLYVEVDESKPINRVPTEMNSFFKQCVNEQLGLSILKKIKILTDFSQENIVKEIDRNMVKRAVQNVISNAIKFSYPHSTVKISSKLENGNIILKILDSGVGIPETLQQEVFKKFSLAQRAGTNGEPSTGLGMCFTKQCIEQHNGHLYFKSTEGKGTKFYISL